MYGQILWLLFAVIALVLLVPSVGMAGMGFHMMGPRMGYGGLSWTPFVTPVLLLLVGVGVYLLIAGRGQSGNAGQDRAITIARERYARGGITREEFAEIRKTILDS